MNDYVNHQNGYLLYRTKSNLSYDHKKDYLYGGVMFFILGLIFFLIGYFVISPGNIDTSLSWTYVTYLYSIVYVLFGTLMITDNLRVTLPAVYKNGFIPEKQKIRYIFFSKQEMIKFKNLSEIHFPSENSSALKIKYKNGWKRFIGHFGMHIKEDKKFCEVLRNQIKNYSKETNGDIVIKESKAMGSRFGSLFFKKVESNITN